MSSDKLWLDEETAYAVVIAEGATTKLERRGLSHSEAMRLAETLRDGGQVAVVMHVIAGESHEVDRYPAR